MKRSAAYIALLLVVVVIAAVLSVRVMTREQNVPEPEKTEAPQQTVTQPPTEAPETPAVTLPPQTPAPTETPQETEKPFETRAPIETEPPEETEPPTPVDASGSFRSDTGTWLNLVANWEAYSLDEDTVSLTVALSTESYSFYTSALYHSLELSVNGKTYSASSPEVAYDGAEVACTPLNSFTVEVPRGTTTLNVVWHYKGSYSGTELTDITASAVIDLQ